MSRFQLHQMGRDEQPSTGEPGAQGVRGRRAELIALRDTETGAEAIVWPGLGNNCRAARLPLQLDGLRGNVDALKGRPSLAELRQTPAFWGVPLLFPFPSRVPGGEYEFEGQRYVMPRDFHGFALDAAWRVAAS